MYAVDGIPHVQFQGTTPEIGGGNDCYERYLAHYNTIEPTNSPIDLTFNYTITDVAINVIADVTLTGDVTTPDNQIFFLVTRKINEEYFCTVEVYEAQDFTQTTNGDVAQYNQSLTIDSNWTVTDLSIVVMVQSTSGNYDIIQATRGDIRPNSTVNVTATNMYTNVTIPNALVKAIPTDANSIMLDVYSTHTDENGQCALPVYEGIYDIQVEYEGYVDYIETDLNIDPDNPATVNAQMDELVLPPANLSEDVAGNWVWLQWAPPGLPEYNIEEDFQTGFPTDWNATTNASVGWQISSNGSSQYFPIPAHTTYIYTNDDANQTSEEDVSDGSEDWLVMPTMDFTNLIDCALSFDSFFTAQYNQLASVNISLDGGTTWDVLLALTGSDSWQTITIDLSEYLDQSNVLIGFHSDDNGGWATGWAIDNVKVGFLGMNTLVQGYNIYMDTNTIPTNNELISDLEYIVTDVPLGQHDFVVKALFNPGESIPCNVVNAEVTVDRPFYPPTQFSYGLEYVVDLTVSWSIPNPVRIQRIDSNGNVSGEAGRVYDRDRDHIGYNIYRDGEFVSFVEGTNTTTYQITDHDFGSFIYTFSSVYSEGESFQFGQLPVLIQEQDIPALFMDDLEEMSLWQPASYPWTTYDIDQSETYSMAGATFPGAGEAMPFITFDPQSTTPPMEEYQTAHSGNVCLATFAAESTANDDWLISEPVELNNLPYVSFWARSLTTQYGQDQFEVAVSNGSTSPEDFIVISGDTPLSVPQGWTNINVSLADYEDQLIRVGIHCVSDGTLAFLVDDIGIYSAGGVGNDDHGVTPTSTRLVGNYPNPFNPTTNIAFDLKDAGNVQIDIYDIKGRKIKSLINDNFTVGSHSVLWDGKDNNNQTVSSGVYFYKLSSGDFQATNKMIMMK